MAIGTPVERLAGTTAGVISSPFTVHPASAIAAGTVAILFFTSGANKTITAVSDAKGNTWTVDHTASDGARALSVVSCQVAAQIATTDAVNITLSNTTSSAADYWIEEVSGLATSSVFDTSHDGSGSGTAPSSGATTTLAQADEIVFGLHRTSAGSATWTKGASYSNPTTPSTATTSALEYKIVSVTTAVTADGTFGTTGSWSSTVVTYKAAAAGSPPSNTVAPAVTGTATVGSGISVTTGTWTDAGSPTFTYQWKDSTDGSTGWANISAATSSTYTIASGEMGKYIRCDVTDTDANGSTTASSNVVGPIAVTITAVRASASSAARVPAPAATVAAVRFASSSAARVASPTLVVAGARSSATSAARAPTAKATVTAPRQNASAAARAPVPRFQITQPRAQATSVFRVPGILIPTTVVAPRMAAAAAMRTVGIASVPNIPGTVVVSDRAAFSVAVTDTTVGTVTVSAS